jgi:Berberine and berberine like
LPPVIGLGAPHGPREGRCHDNWPLVRYGHRSEDAAFWPGDLAEGARVLAPLRAFGTPLIDTIRPLPYPVWQQMFDPKYPHGRRYYWKANLLAALSGAVLTTLIDHAAAPPLPWLNATIEFYAGPMNRVGASETAFPHREARYQLIVVGASDDPADDETAIAWARQLYAAIQPHSLNGAFLNFNTVDGVDRPDRITASYGNNWRRLVAVKRRYDPTHLFQENNNIAP